MLAGLFWPLLAAPIRADEFVATTAGGISGAIVPAEILRRWRDMQRDHDIRNMLGIAAEEFWTPSAEDVQLIEKRLTPLLELGEKDPSILNERPSRARDKLLSEQIREIRVHYGDYRRQYLGFVIRGERYIYINSFCGGHDDDYTHRYIMVFDGGRCAWQALYSISKERLVLFAVNGEA